MNLRETVQVG